MLMKMKTHPKGFRGALRIRRKVLCLSVTPARNSRDEEDEDEDEELLFHTLTISCASDAREHHRETRAERRYLTLCVCVRACARVCVCV